MIIALVQKKTGSNIQASSTTTVSCVMTSGPTQNNLLVCTIMYESDGGALTPPTGFTQAFSHINPSGPDVHLYNLWQGYKVAGASESSTITATFGSNNFSTVAVHEYSGCATVSPFDVGAQNDAGFTSGTSLATGTTSATAQASAVAVAALVVDGPTTGRSWSNSFVNQLDDSLDWFFTADKILSATGTQTTTASWTTSHIASACIGVYKGAAAAPTGRSTGMLTGVLTKAWQPLRSWRKRSSGLVVPELAWI